MILNAQEVLRIFDYNPLTGEFFWKIRVGRRGVIGKRAGYRMTNGYRMIKYGGKNYLEAHLAWLAMTGNWPKEQIDHIDRDRSNNKISNLRQATHCQNMMNRTATKRNKYLSKGVDARGRKFMARIRANGHRQYLGLFSTFVEAKAAYDRAARLLHGEFFHP